MLANIRAHARLCALALLIALLGCFSTGCTPEAALAVGLVFGGAVLLDEMNNPGGGSSRQGSSPSHRASPPRSRAKIVHTRTARVNDATRRAPRPRPTGDYDLAVAIQAFERGDYESAQRSVDVAIRKGLSRPILVKNAYLLAAAVAFYDGRQHQADQHLRRLFAYDRNAFIDPAIYTPEFVRFASGVRQSSR